LLNNPEFLGSLAQSGHEREMPDEGYFLTFPLLGKQVASVEFYTALLINLDE